MVNFNFAAEKEKHTKNIRCFADVFPKGNSI